MLFTVYYSLKKDIAKQLLNLYYLNKGKEKVCFDSDHKICESNITSMTYFLCVPGNYFSKTEQIVVAVP